MQNIEMLFEKNRNRHHTTHTNLNKNILEIEITAQNNMFTGVQISQIINIINDAHKKYGKLKYSVHFYLGNVMFIDKLTYVFLECICYYLIEKYGHPVQVFMRVRKDIGTDGIDSSPLLLLNGTKKDKIRLYPNRFRFDIYEYHFRRLINGVGKEETNYLGDLYEEVDSFLKRFSIDYDCRDEVGHVVTELVGNAGEHALTNCLIDIDVAPNYQKYKGKELVDDNYYYGINIAVVNFSHKLLGDDIETNIIQNLGGGKINDRYDYVLKAYSNHSAQFSEYYTKNDFCNITAFQKKISGRPEKAATGGTGLPFLIKSLEEKSEKHKCYVISGNRCVNFYENMLEYDKAGWISFNRENDYLKNIPGEDVVTECLIYMPGTAYNFNFIMKGEPINEKDLFRI